MTNFLGRSTSALAAHLIRFLMYNFVGALFPAFISFLLHTVANVPAPSGTYAPELLFFAIMISFTALGDITDETRVSGDSPFFQLIKGILSFGAFTAAVFLGAYQLNVIAGLGSTSFRDNITTWTLIIATFLFLPSFATEFFIAKIKAEAS